MFTCGVTSGLLKGSYVCELWHFAYSKWRPTGPGVRHTSPLRPARKSERPAA